MKDYDRIYNSYAFGIDFIDEVHKAEFTNPHVCSECDRLMNIINTCINILTNDLFSEKEKIDACKILFKETYEKKKNS